MYSSVQMLSLLSTISKTNFALKLSWDPRVLVGELQTSGRRRQQAVQVQRCACDDHKPVDLWTIQVLKIGIALSQTLANLYHLKSSFVFKNTHFIVEIPM